MRGFSSRILPSHFGEIPSDRYVIDDSRGSEASVDCSPVNTVELARRSKNGQSEHFHLLVPRPKDTEWTIINKYPGLPNVAPYILQKQLTFAILIEKERRTSCNIG